MKMQSTLLCSPLSAPALSLFLALITTSGAALAQSPPHGPADACVIGGPGGCVPSPFRKQRPLTPEIRTRADQAVARIQSDPRLSEAFERAMASNDTDAATNLLRSNGFSEAGEYPIGLNNSGAPDPHESGDGGVVARSPKWRCGFYFKSIDRGAEGYENELGFTCHW